jgi:nitrite reductase (NADH) large subunit
MPEPQTARRKEKQGQCSKRWEKTMANFVIIGNGAAGAAAAEKIHSSDPEAKITIYGKEPEPFYYRPRLIDFLSGEVEPEAFTLRDQAWYDERGIAYKMGEAVTKVDLPGRRVMGNKGSESAFDALLLANGANPFVPPMPGSDLEGVFALRNLADARMILERARNIDRAILIGGGLLGLEAGYALTRLGLQVQVVEFFDRLLPRQMDSAAAAKLQSILEAKGFSFYLGAESKEISAAKGNLALELKDGQMLEGGLVLFSAGIRPDLTLAKDMGLEVDKGVKVDDHLMTSQRGVWAAGDLVEHEGRIYGIWPAAQEQGEIAGTNMAGGDAFYGGTVMSNSLKVVGVDLTSAGDIDADGKLSAAIYDEGEVYRKIVLDEGVIKGFIFFGLTQGVKECSQALKQGQQVGHLAEAMSEKDFDWNQLLK